MSLNYLIKSPVHFWPCPSSTPSPLTAAAAPEHPGRPLPAHAVLRERAFERAGPPVGRRRAVRVLWTVQPPGSLPHLHVWHGHAEVSPDPSVSLCSRFKVPPLTEREWEVRPVLKPGPFCSLQMYSQCDTGAGDHAGPEPRAAATLHHADHGHHEETGKTLIKQNAVPERSSAFIQSLSWEIWVNPLKQGCQTGFPRGPHERYGFMFYFD